MVVSNTQILFILLFLCELVLYASNFLRVDYKGNTEVKDFLTTIPLIPTGNTEIGHSSLHTALSC